MDFLKAGLVEVLLEEVQVVVEVSVVCQPKALEKVDFLEADLVRQHPSQCLVEAVVPVLDEQYLATTKQEG